MRVNPHLLVCTLAALSSIGYAQMTLEIAVASALTHDPTINKVQADMSEAVGFAREVKADLLPQVFIEGHVGPAYRDRGASGVDASSGDIDLSRRASITGRQHLWDGGFNRYRWKDAKQRVEAKERLVNAQREATALGTVQAYLDVIRARKQIRFAKQSVGAHDKVLNLANERAEAAGNQADIELSSARQGLARTLLLERELALREAEANFVRWVGVMPPDSLAVPCTPRISSISEIDPKLNFHYLATLKQHEAAVLEKRAFEKRYGPKFFLEANAGVGQEVLGTRGQDNGASLLIVGSWDIFDGGRRKAKVAQAAADIERQLAIISETLVLLNLDISARWEDYRTINQRIDVLRKYAGSLDSTVSLYQQQFDLGTRPLLSLLDIQNESISASIRIADGERDRTLLGYRLLFFGGRLIPNIRSGDCDGKSIIEPIFESSKNLVPLDSASIRKQRKANSPIIAKAAPVEATKAVSMLFRHSGDLRIRPFAADLALASQ